jgi:predicted metal-dependent phosphoesterase TrpH
LRDLRVDLHLHTTASDGCWPPERLIAEVRQAGICLFAVTDHDSLGNLARTADLVQGSGLRFLPGVEISTRLNGQVYHMLAYGVDPEDAELTALVQDNEARLVGASDAAVRLLASAGYPISLDDYEEYTWDRQRGGWKALNFLIDLGLCRDVHDYFGRLFTGELAHPEASFHPLEEVIPVAQRAGGTLVLAHPGAAFYNGLDTARLDELVSMGLQGLECFATYHDEVATRRFLDYCHSRDLLVTGGSDSHGGFAGRILGLPPIYTSSLRLGGLADQLVT